MNKENTREDMPASPPAGQELEKENPFKHNKVETKDEKKRNNKIKILVYADSPTVNTGFGVVNRNILRRLHDTGKYEINIWGINFVGIPYDHEEFPYNIYPAALSQTGDLYGRQQFLDFMVNTEFDILWCLNDPFIISTFLPEAVVAFRREAPEKIFQWIFYFPIDTPHFKKSWLVPIMTADFPVCYNSWTYKKLVEAVPELRKKLTTIYHGVDEKTFYPLSDEEIKTFRKDYWKDWIKEDTFLIVNVNRNQQRKDFYRTLKSFKLLKNRHPNSHLYMHCKVDDMGGNLIEMAAQVGLKPREDFSYPDPKHFHPAMGLPTEVLNKIYNAADVVVSTSLGEGMFIKGTKVKIEDGWKNIEDIKDTDLVLTHKNRYMPVLKTMKKKFKENAYQINLWKFNLPFICSHDHPIYTTKGFVEAKDLRIGDIIKYKIDDKKNNFNQFDLSWYMEKDNKSYHIKNNFIISRHSKIKHKTPVKLKITEDFLKVVGYYLSEGSLTKNKKKISGIQFSLHIKNDSKIIADIYKWADNNIPDYSVQLIQGKREKDRNCLNLIISNSLIGRMFGDWFGSNCKRKNIPDDILRLDKIKLKILLSALIAGDGDIGSGKAGSKYFRYKTVSFDLMNSVKDLMLKLGYIPSIQKEDNSKGFNKNGYIYTLRVNTGIPKEKNKNFMPKGYIKNGFLHLPIRKIKKININGKFGYDLQVPNDNSYTIFQATVHNCGLSAYEAMATKTPILMSENTALIETMAEGRGMPVKCGMNDNMFTVMPMDNSVIRPLVDIYDMVKKLDKLAKDEELRKKIAQRGYEWIMTKKWDIICEDWIKIFEKASNKIRQQRAGIIMPTDDIDGGIAGASGL